MSTEMILSEQQNGRALSAPAEGLVTRQAQEVQAAMVVAKKFPRDEAAAFTRIMKACQRLNLAKAAIYAYPKGGQKVEGPSIRLAEALAQNWGNIDFGMVELDSGPDDSTVMAYAWDLETNTRSTKIFTVRHWRDTKQGGKKLTDARDVYENLANQGARRMRACILAIIPGDIVDAALSKVEETLKSEGKDEPLSDRVRKMVAGFDKFGVTQAQIEKRLGHRIDATSEHELVQLRKIYASIRDQFSKAEEWFPPEPAGAAPPAKPAQPPAAPKPDAATDHVPAQAAPPAEEAAPAPPPFDPAEKVRELKAAVDAADNSLALSAVLSQLTAAKPLIGDEAYDDLHETWKQKADRITSAPTGANKPGMKPGRR